MQGYIEVKICEAWSRHNREGSRWRLRNAKSPSARRVGENGKEEDEPSEQRQRSRPHSRGGLYREPGDGWWALGIPIDTRNTHRQSHSPSSSSWDPSGRANSCTLREAPRETLAWGAAATEPERGGAISMFRVFAPAPVDSGGRGTPHRPKPEVPAHLVALRETSPLTDRRVSGDRPRRREYSGRRVELEVPRYQFRKKVAGWPCCPLLEWSDQEDKTADSQYIGPRRRSAGGTWALGGFELRKPKLRSSEDRAKASRLVIGTFAERKGMFNLEPMNAGLTLRAVLGSKQGPSPTGSLRVPALDGHYSPKISSLKPSGFARRVAGRGGAEPPQERGGHATRRVAQMNFAASAAHAVREHPSFQISCHPDSHNRDKTSGLSPRVREVVKVPHGRKS
ncbi:hypothetical protein LXA43DRAFT_1078965 [Ganoderma leucocontextum]|nr:hypothetical protein LXA43DRAFT_1078965 [Ganoderma leucocontextum]